MGVSCEDVSLVLNSFFVESVVIHSDSMEKW